MLYLPTFEDMTDYLSAFMLREFTEMNIDTWWFDNVARFDHFQLRPMRRKGVFF